MERPIDPAHVRVGINLGSSEDGIVTAKLMTTMNEVMSRMLNLARLAIVAGPLVVHSFFIHSGDFSSWLLRLIAIYVLAGLVSFVCVPEQMYNGMGLRGFRWMFEMFYPDITTWNGSMVESEEKMQPAIVGGVKISDFAGCRIKLRWHGKGRYLCLTADGWAVTGDESFAVTLLVQHVFAKEKKVPDTYTFRVIDPAIEWHQSWLSFSPINHLRLGGWLGAFRDQGRACPYKVIQDSSCPPGTCKLMNACTTPPPPSQRFCTGFYLAEQLSGGQLYIGHAPDRDAALMEFVLV